MQTTTMLWILVLLMCSLSVSGQAIPSCRSFKYPDDNGTCQPCQKRCKSCVSNTTCTECQVNYWGVTCEFDCSQQCTNQCHAEYGHCTYGCPDGTFSQQHSKKCINCLRNCEVCNSLSACIRCRARFYGPVCLSCPNSCVDNRCNTSTGECFACKEGYFHADGICQKCPDGCTSCNDIRYCSKCDDGFYGPRNGKCFLKCRNTTQTTQFLASSKDKCGITNGLLYNNQNTCEDVSSDQSYTCSTNRFCLLNRTWSSDDDYSLNQDDVNSTGLCLKIMSEVCFSECQPPKTAYREYIKYLCNQTCTVENVVDEWLGADCFHGDTPNLSNGSTVENRLSKIEVLCFQDADHICHTSESSTWHVIAIIFIMLFLMQSGILVLLFMKRRDRRSARLPFAKSKIEPRVAECPARVRPVHPGISESETNRYDVVNRTANRNPIPFEESGNFYQHARPQFILQRDSMYDHALPAGGNANRLEVEDDSEEETAVPLYDFAQAVPSEDHQFCDDDTVQPDDCVKPGNQDLYTEIE